MLDDVIIYHENPVFAIISLTYKNFESFWIATVAIKGRISLAFRTDRLRIFFRGKREKDLRGCLVREKEKLNPMNFTAGLNLGGGNQKIFDEFFMWQCGTEQVSLHNITAERSQKILGFNRFHPLGNGFHFEGVG